MATEQRFKLHFQTTADTAALKQMNAEVRQGDAAVKQLTQTTKVHTAAVHTDAAGMRSWVDNARKTIPELQRLQRAQAAAAINAGEQQRQANMVKWGNQWRGSAGKPGGAAGGGKGGAGGGERDPARALLLASQGIEDAQYGIAGVLNNIPSLIMALGGGAGLAGALSIAAVGASQLWKIIGDGSEEAAETINRLTESATAMKAEFEAAGATIRDKFAADIKTAREAADKELTAWRRSLEAGGKSDRRDDERGGMALDEALGGDALATERDILNGTPEAEAEAARKEAERLRVQNDTRDRLKRDQESALNNAERAKNGVQAGQAAISQAQGTLAAVPGQRQAEIDRLRQGGILSDQEQIVSDHDTASRQGRAYTQSAVKAEGEVEALNQLMRDNTMNPTALAGFAAERSVAKSRAAASRKNANEANAKADSLAPFADQAAEDLRTGKATYNRALERTDLTPAQRSAVEQGKTGLANIDATEADAKGRIEKAKAEITAAQEGLKEFVEAVRTATGKLQDFETRAGADNIDAGRTGPLDAPLPTLPGQNAPVPSLGPDLPAAPEMPSLDVRPQTDAVSEAMRDSQRLVQQALGNMADVATQQAEGTATAVSSLSARLRAAETKIQGMKGMITE